MHISLIDFLIFLMLLTSITIISYCLLPGILEHIRKKEQSKLDHASKELGEMFVEVSSKQLQIFSTLSIVGMTTLGFFFFKFIGAGLGFVVGVLLPVIVVAIKKKKRKTKFLEQLIDTITVLNSGLKAGLSFQEAIDLVSRDMSPPTSDEFALVSREVKMGVSLDNALIHLDDRMDLEELRYVISAVLVAREVGGALPAVLKKLEKTIRSQMRLKENIKTYTIQGRIQSFIITLIPFVFLFIVLKQDPNHFDIMLTTDIGRILLVAAGFLDILGIFLVIRMSKIKI